MGARTVDHLFFRTGIPTRISAEDASERLTAAADRLHDHIARQKSPGLMWHLKRSLDRAVMKRLMFNKNPETYANVIRSWRERGWMK
ncbi:MAG: hypothetical protein JXL80_17730, partial [Planctomycetes bacterium]|nr:hypothetical protein [Planctomycetota bacterium]